MKIQNQIEAKLVAAFNPERMQLVNESNNHSVPPGSESHFNLILVSDVFEGQSPVSRQRSVFSSLGELMQQIHALTMKTLTVKEWEDAGGEVANPAPPCAGGGKKSSNA